MIKKKIKNQKRRYQKIQDQLDKTGENQVSTSDPESRQMIVRNNITEVAYNAQTIVDAKHNIPAYNVENFEYCYQTDTYTFPQGNNLTTK